MSTQHGYFFGYGSLVNRATHGFGDVHVARLRGWRRVWRHTSLREVSYLTVVPDAGSEIDGLIAAVPGGDWAALDEREGAYDRVGAGYQVSHPLDHAASIAVYAVPLRNHGAPGVRGPVLLSYVDVVIQGYLREFGAAGARRFFETTDGWDAPFVDDRAAPRYPRHCTLTGSETALVDTLLRSVGAQVMG